MSEEEPLWRPVRADHLQEARKTDRMHVALASGLLVVTVGTAATLDPLPSRAALLLVATIAVAFASLTAGVIHLLLLEKYLGHLAQQLTYTEAMGKTPGAHEAMYQAWLEERSKMPKERTLRSWRAWKLRLGLLGLACYAIFGAWLVYL